MDFLGGGFVDSHSLFGGADLTLHIKGFGLL